MREKGSSENHKINNLKVIIDSIAFLDFMKLCDMMKDVFRNRLRKYDNFSDMV